MCIRDSTTAAAIASGPSRKAASAVWSCGEGDDCPIAECGTTGGSRVRAAVYAGWAASDRTSARYRNRQLRRLVPACWGRLIAGRGWVLGRRGWRRRGGPRRVGEIEELVHRGLSTVARGERFEAEALFHQIQHGGGIAYSVRDIVLVGEGRNHDDRNTVASPGEAAHSIPKLPRRRADIVQGGIQIGRILSLIHI